MLRLCARACANSVGRATGQASRRLPVCAVVPGVGVQQQRCFSAEKQADLDAGSSSPERHAELLSTMDIEGVSAANIKPDGVLELAFPPFGMCPVSIKIKFPGSGDLKPIPPEMAKMVPMISLTGPFLEGDKFTVIMTDPDAPSRENPAFREFIHYAAVDVPLFPDNSLSLPDGAQAIPYVGPGPPCKTGFHRYVFLVYEQPEDMNSAAVYMGLMQKLGDRGGKKAALVAKELGLGDPVAYGGFLSEWEKYVDEVHEKLDFLPPPGSRSPKQVAKHGDE